MDNDSITAIVIIGLPTIVWGGYAVFRAWIKFEERKLEIMGGFGRSNKLNQSNESELEAKIRHVQEVSNEYALSIQHTLDNIQQRLDFLESNIRVTPSVRPYSVSQPEEQIVARTNSE